jgi:hypothetical protein
MKELKAHVFNVKEEREIPYEYWRSLSSNLLGNLSVHLLWSWIKEIGAPHARSLARLAEPGVDVTSRVKSSGADGRTWCVAGRDMRPLLLAVDGSLIVTVTRSP